MYQETRPGAFVDEPSKVNHIAWSLLLIVIGLIFWAGLALTNAENQRYAIMTKQCQDRLFPAELNNACLTYVQSRPHWWQHVLYGLGHVAG